MITTPHCPHCWCDLPISRIWFSVYLCAVNKAPELGLWQLCSSAGWLGNPVRVYQPLCFSFSLTPALVREHAYLVRQHIFSMYTDLVLCGPSDSSFLLLQLVLHCVCPLLTESLFVFQIHLKFQPQASIVSSHGCLLPPLSLNMPFCYWAALPVPSNSPLLSQSLYSFPSARASPLFLPIIYDFHWLFYFWKMGLCVILMEVVA